MMTLDEAKTFLSKCTRNELNDHAFGDSEVSWFLDGKEVASGYFGSTSRSVSICQGCEGIDHTTHHSSFEGAEAQALRYGGTRGEVERNDETGPDTYTEGRCMPGLTLEGVRRELETQVEMERRELRINPPP